MAMICFTGVLVPHTRLVSPLSSNIGQPSLLFCAIDICFPKWCFLMSTSFWLRPITLARWSGGPNHALCSFFISINQKSEDYYKLLVASGRCSEVTTAVNRTNR